MPARPISPQARARTCGFVYVILIFAGLFGDAFVRSPAMLPSQ
jgi:hypothetical protein